VEVGFEVELFTGVAVPATGVSVMVSFPIGAVPLPVVTLLTGAVTLPIGVVVTLVTGPVVLLPPIVYSMNG
jgi:hypothetical protein